MKAKLLAAALAVALLPTVALAQNPAGQQCGGGCIGDPDTAMENATTAAQSERGVQSGGRVQSGNRASGRAAYAFAPPRAYHQRHYYYRHH
jgi:hypothetical protein